MVELRHRLFLVVGLNFQQRQHALDIIKTKILHDTRSSLTSLTVYAKEINSNDFKEKALTVSFEKNRILLIKDALVLSDEVKDFFLKHCEKIMALNYIIIEVEKNYMQWKEEKKVLADTFFKFILKNATIYKSATSSSENYFEALKISVRKADVANSLFVLDKLFTGKVREEALGVQVLGWLVSECSYMRDPYKKEKYLEFLWEADRAMKEGGLAPKTALEIALVKLLGS
jgi:hypothetical protein